MAQPFIRDAFENPVAESHDEHDARASRDGSVDECLAVAAAKSDDLSDTNNLAPSTPSPDNSTDRGKSQTLATKSDEDCDKEADGETSTARGKFFLILRLCLAIMAHSFTVSGALLVINMISKLVAVRDISSDPNMAHVIGTLALSSDAAARIIAGIISFRLTSLLAFM